MRRVHMKWRRGAIVAAASAAALTASVLATSPAEAIPNKADLSITKTVRPWSATTLAVPDDFIPGLSDTRATGHYELAGSGLRIWTSGATSTDKVAEYFTHAGPLPDSASLAWTGSATPPGTQIVFDVDGTTGNGNDYNILVGEPVYGANWWLTNGSSAEAKAADPSGANNGGNGSAYFGTLAAWKSALPNARMYAGGFSLGSGVLGDGVIGEIVYDSTHYTFGGWSSSIQAAPGETVEYKLTVANAPSAGLAAAGVQVLDTLPSDLTYVEDSLIDNGNACAFSGQTLTCNPGTFPPGVSTSIRFKATLDRDIDNGHMPSTIGHNVTVQKQETFADLPAHQTKTYTTFCPTGYTATDGSLLIDAVDQGGFYSDIVTTASGPNGTNTGWTVTATNFGDFRGQGKVHVTCLSETLGSSSGHTHDIQVDPTVSVIGSWANASGDNGRTVNVQCDPGERPISPAFTVNTGLLTVRESYAHNPRTWRFVVDTEEDTDATFSVRCLKPETTASNGHTATIAFSEALATTSVGAESRSEGQVTCPGTAHAIVGGYAGYTADVRSLGKEPRGTTYMFRFFNEDWDFARPADVLVTCVGVRTADEPTFYTVTNTATVSTPTLEANASDNSSSATVKVVGDPAPLPPFAVVVGPTGTRSLNANNRTKTVNLQVKCEAPCTFNVKVYDGSTVVANANKSLAGAAGFKTVKVKTTSAGKNLGNGDVEVKVTTADGSETYDVALSGLS